MPHLSRRATALPFTANETVIFRVRQSGKLLVSQLVLLAVIGLIFVLVIGQLDGIRGPLIGRVSLAQILIILGFIGIGLVSLTRLLEYATTLYTLTNRRVQHDFGIFLKTSYAIPLDQIESLDIKESFLGRLLQYGNLEMRPTSAVIRYIRFTAISGPKGRREQVEEQLP